MIDGHERGVSSERGAALVVAILVLLIVGVLAAFVSLNSVTNSKIAVNDQSRARALDLAEAGVSEAVTRIKSAEVPNTSNARMVTQIYLTPSGSVPVLGTDSTGLATAQPAGSWLSYSTAARDPRALTVTYKTNAAKTVIYKYDAAKSPPVQTVSGQPIFEIKSSGKAGTAVRTILADVVATDRKSTRLNSSHLPTSRMPSSA